MSIERVGIIGAGQMGGGIAHVCALAGYDVILEDVNAEQLGAAPKASSKRTCTGRRRAG